MEAGLVSGARTLLMRLDAMNAVDDRSQGRIPALPPGCFQDASTQTPALLLHEGGLASPGGGEGKWSPPPPVSHGKSRYLVAVAHEVFASQLIWKCLAAKHVQFANEPAQ